MTETPWIALRRLLTDRYDEFRKRLAHRLGSDDLARETLHETWLHLHGRDTIGTIVSPSSYLLRMALNLATDRGRKEVRLARRIEVNAVLEIADESPGPDRDVDARRDIATLERALEELTPRRRTILLTSRLEGLPLREIAERIGVSQRLVEIELKHAVEHCADRLDRKITRRFGPMPLKPS